jgi:putative DNA primase/helicase
VNRITHRARIMLEQLHNFVITPQISMTLDDNGMERIAQAVKERFGKRRPTLLSLIRLRNVFDGGGIGGENDNDAMMFFMSRRVEALRQKINPNAGIIIAHHTKKIFKKQVEEDPFQSFSGAGALRSYYTSGILLHRPDESRPERTLLFELRNGREINPKNCAEKRGERWVDVIFQIRRMSRTYQHIRTYHAHIVDEAAQNRVYTARQFSDRFENHGSLGSSRLIRHKLQGLIDAEHYQVLQEW